MEPLYAMEYRDEPGGPRTDATTPVMAEEFTEEQLKRGRRVLAELGPDAKRHDLYRAVQMSNTRARRLVRFLELSFFHWAWRGPIQNILCPHLLLHRSR